MASKRALITGITGQDGSYLAELLLQKGYEVHGIKRRSSSFNTGRIDHIYEDSHMSSRQLILHYGDMTDSTNLLRIVKEVAPDEIYNLAAQSHVQVSFESPEYTANADALGTTRLLEAIRLLDLGSSVKFYQASTSEMFGLSSQNQLDEASQFYPRSPYAIAKLYAHWMTINYREAYGFFASNGILFNHESPRRGETFVTKKIVNAAVEIIRKQKEVLFLGNLDSVRDWGHAKDYVNGMWKILQFEKADDWVLATGYAISVRDFVVKTFKYLDLDITWKGKGLSEVGMDQNGKIRIKVDSRYFRPTEVPYLLGNATKARTLLDWHPEIDLDALIADMVANELSKKLI